MIEPLSMKGLPYRTCGQLACCGTCVELGGEVRVQQLSIPCRAEKNATAGTRAKLTSSVILPRHMEDIAGKVRGSGAPAGQSLGLCYEVVPPFNRHAARAGCAKSEQ